MKTMYHFNKIVFVVTLLLYITIYFGLLSQMILGVIQVICAAILFLYWNKLNAKTKNQLSIYWIVICLYGLCWLPNWKFLDETVMLVFVVVILPTAIAGYFLYILNTIKNENTKKPHITL